MGIPDSAVGSERLRLAYRKDYVSGGVGLGAGGERRERELQIRPIGARENNKAI